MKLKVMNFNICCGDDPGGNTIAERAPRVEKIVRKYAPDIIGLQEYTPIWKPHIERIIGDEYEIFNKYRAESNLESTPILWKKEKFECLKKGYFWLSDTPDTESKGWDELYDCFRICEYVVLRDKKEGICFTYMNTHYGFGDKGQASSSRLIYERSKIISDFPTVITGDFNMCAGSAGYNEMIKYFTDVNEATVKNYSETFHNYGVKSDDASENSPDEDINGRSKLHIDYCFVNKGVIPLNQRIIKDLPDGGYPSDHYALISELEIK